MKKTLSNFIYQGIFQITKLLLPIITIPIVSRALGPEGLGVYNYTNSIAQYFVLFAGLGIGVYGNREIAVNRDNKEQLSKTFWELFSLSLLFSIVSLAVYLIIVSFSENRLFFYCQSLTILAALFDISWFFMGIEDFKKTSLSSLFAQIIAFVLIVTTVKDETDIYKYILIQGAYLLVSQGVMWLFIRNEIHWVKVKFISLKRHFSSAIYYFIPKIAIILYTNLNKTLLEWLDSTVSVGYYSNSLVINSVVVTLVTTLDLVLLPKMSNLVSKGNKKEILGIMNITLDMQLFVTIAAMFGLSAIAEKLVPWFYGDKFLILQKTIPMLSFLIIIIPLGMGISRQYLLPFNKVKVYNMAVINGAIISIIANFLLIPVLGLYGAIIATLLAELFVTVTRTYSFVKETGFHFDLKKIGIYIFSGAIMFISVKLMTLNFPAKAYTTLIQCCIGVIIYIGITSLLKVNPLLILVKNRLSKKDSKY